MQILTVSYARVFNLGNYENERISVEIQLEAGDSAMVAMERAKAFVNVNAQQKNPPAQQVGGSSPPLSTMSKQNRPAIDIAP